MLLKIIKPRCVFFDYGKDGRRESFRPEGMFLTQHEIWKDCRLERNYWYNACVINPCIIVIKGKTLYPGRGA